MAQYEVGRGSVREALRILEVQGIISIRRGPAGGTVVADLDNRDFARTWALHLRVRQATYHDLVEARLLLEPFMAGLAANRRTEETSAALLAVTSQARLVADKDSEALIASFAAFHHAVEAMSGNVVLDLAGTSLAAINQGQPHAWDPLRDRLISKEGRRTTQDAHEEIAKAIARGQRNHAERLMRAHLTELLTCHTDPRGMEDVIAWE